MKTEIHPEYVEAHVRCTCGNEFTTRATRPELHVEVCSNCHPFYTGRQKLVDTGGRVERFQRRVAKGRARSAQARRAEPDTVRVGAAMASRLVAGPPTPDAPRRPSRAEERPGVHRDGEAAGPARRAARRSGGARGRDDARHPQLGRRGAQAGDRSALEAVEAAENGASAPSDNVLCTDFSQEDPRPWARSRSRPFR